MCIYIDKVKLGKEYPINYFSDTYDMMWCFGKGNYNLVYFNQGLQIGIIEEISKNNKIVGEKLIQLYSFFDYGLDAKDICKRVVSNIIAKDFSNML